MADDHQKKTCAQCGQEKLLAKHFHRTKNGKDGYMKMCKDCFTENKQERDRRAQLEMERIHREWEERRKLAREMEARHARVAEQAEKHRQEQQALLDAWFAQQPPRTCIVCHETKAAVEFGYSEIATQANGHWFPARLHQRCSPCHEMYREKYRKPCVICQQGYLKVAKSGSAEGWPPCRSARCPRKSPLRAGRREKDFEIVALVLHAGLVNYC